MTRRATTSHLVVLGETPGLGRDLVGGKARHLAQMTAEGFPVPRAAALTTVAYKEFMSTPVLERALGALRDAASSGEPVEELGSRFESLGAMVENLDLPPDLVGEIARAWQLPPFGRDALAVRSSGTLEDAVGASFSGMLTSVIGVETQDELLDAIKRCWLSASRPRVLAYARSRGIPLEDLDVAIVIQRLVRAERAGLVFTRDPVNRYARGVVVEATHGVGEEIVSGEATPERYIYYPRDERVDRVADDAGRASSDDSTPAPSLAEAEVAELARLGLQAEALFGSPQDVEWVYGEGRFWTLQSRPLVFSTSEDRVFPQVAEETVLLHGVGASPKVGSGRVVLGIEGVPQEAAGAVVVLSRLTNDLAVRLRDAAGVIADEGGATSHGANLLREFGVPAVISTGHATERLVDGMTVTVDGFRGNVYEGDLSVGPKTFDGVPSSRMKVYASVLVPEKARAVAPFADGVSSLRNDYFLLSSGVHPAEMIRRGHADELEQTILSGILDTTAIFAGKPVWYKTMDAPTDEFRRLAGGEQEPRERNPLLGWRGIGRELAEPEMLGVELRAVAGAVAEGHDNIGIKLPFARFPHEVAEAIEAVRRLGLRPGHDVQVGVSVETPAMVLRLRDALDIGAAFVSVGASDLTMCTLALDRESHRVAEAFDPAHPAVVELLERIVETCRSAGVFVCVTGESARDDRLLPHLVRMDYDAIGVSPAYFAEVKTRIHALEEA
jgi:pyruvate,water dikinase